MIGVGSDCIPFVWPKIKDRVAQALKHGNGEYALEDIFAALCDAEMQLWLTDESVAITAIISYPRMTTCLVVAAAGNLDDLILHLPLLECWSRSEGCDGLELMGRGGWKRALAAAGYREAQVHLRKDWACTRSSEVH